MISLVHRQTGLQLVICACVWLPTVHGQDLSTDDYRVFTDARGRTIKARVVSLSGEQVTIQRTDGKEFTLPLAIFSAADQAYVTELAQPKNSPVKLAKKTTDWAQFRGPGGMGICEGGSLPVQWSDQEHIAWKCVLPGSGASSPITFGEQIYLTAYSGFFVPGESSGSLEALQRHLLAIDRRSGKILWNKSVAAKLPEEERIRDHGFAANTPAADADAVYAFFGKSGVFAFDHQGNELWHADVGSNTNGWGTASSPLLYRDLVIINASVESESLIALDRQTGKQKWRADEIRESWNTPIIATSESGRTELIVARHGDVLSFDPDMGSPLWSCKTDITWYMVPSGVASNGVVYYLGGRSGTASLAVRMGGTGDVTATHRLWTAKHGSNVTSPIYHDGYLYWMSHDGGIAYCARAATGELVYEQRVGRFGQVYASPIMADGKLYYFSREGKCLVLAAKPEFEQLALNELRERSIFDASPGVDGNRLLIRSGKHLYSIGSDL